MKQIDRQKVRDAVALLVTRSHKECPEAGTTEAEFKGLTLRGGTCVPPKFEVTAVSGEYLPHACVDVNKFLQSCSPQDVHAALTAAMKLENAMGLAHNANITSAKLALALASDILRNTENS